MIGLAGLWLALCVPQPGVVDDSCHLIEINHYYDENGKLVFDQIIFWDWHCDGQQHVCAWRLLKQAEQLPCRVRGAWRCVWTDGDVLRRVTAPAMRETWTQYDPELADREPWPKEKRRELRVPIKTR